MNIPDRLIDTLHTISAMQDEKFFAQVEELAEMIFNADLVCFAGNGGSMAQAQHWAGELTGRFKTDRPAKAAVVLGSNPAALTAIANDYGYGNVFEREFMALDDCPLLICLSTSGSSSNIVQLARAARDTPARVVSVGADGHSPLKKESHMYIEIPGTRNHEGVRSDLVQEGTLVLLHMVCERVDEFILNGE